jgi:hypothetical protein
MTHLSDEVSIHMIESGDGRTLQTWVFRYPEVTKISIGRDESASVRLADPYVSRIHLEIVRVDQAWILLARGRNGVFVDGKSVVEQALVHGTRFRLSSVGPMFRFESQGRASAGQTLSLDPAIINLLSLNRQEVHQKADEICQTDYFHRLQEKARLLRQQRGRS